MLIKRFSETAALPRRATEGSAGYDLSADLAAPEVIRPGESKLLPTGIGVALPPQTAGLVFGQARDRPGQRRWGDRLGLPWGDQGAAAQPGQ